MNEQIEKLAVQAFSFASETDDSDESDANWWNAYNEKFAELIVQECCQFNYDFLESYREACEVNSKIREHFGVE